MITCSENIYTISYAKCYQDTNISIVCMCGTVSFLKCPTNYDKKSNKWDVETRSRLILFSHTVEIVHFSFTHKTLITQIVCIHLVAIGTIFLCNMSAMDYLKKTYINEISQINFLHFVTLHFVYTKCFSLPDISSCLIYAFSPSLCSTSANIYIVRNARCHFTFVGMPISLLILY